MINPQIHHCKPQEGRLIWFKRSSDGSLTLEAALTLPLLLAFVLLMISLIRIASAEIALRSAVTETGKSVAGYWAPVRMIYSDAKNRAMGSQAGAWTQEALGRLGSVRSRWTGAEDWILQYEDLLPETVVKLLKWEIDKREGMEDAARENAESTIHRWTDPLLCQAFEPVLRHYSNPKLLREDHLRVEAVKLPSLEPGGSPYVEITASYTLTLPVPFWSKTVRLEHKSYERAWVGDE